MTLTRQALDAALDRLERDVAEWVTHLREPRIFRKQFDALCADIVSRRRLRMRNTRGTGSASSLPATRREANARPDGRRRQAQAGSITRIST